jgi:choline/glycine/proline betaine transport protein
MQAMQYVAKELDAKDWPCSVEFDSDNIRAVLAVIKPEQLDFIYEVRLREYKRPAFSYNVDSKHKDECYYRAEVFLRRGGQTYDVFAFEESELINDILDQFEKYLHFLHISPGILPWKMEVHDDDLLQSFETSEVTHRKTE